MLLISNKSLKGLLVVLQNHVMKDLLPSNLQVVFPDYPRVMHLSTQSEKERKKKNVEIYIVLKRRFR